MKIIQITSQNILLIAQRFSKAEEELESEDMKKKEAYMVSVLMNASEKKRMTLSTIPSAPE